MFIDTVLTGATAEVFKHATHRLVDDIRVEVPRLGEERVYRYEVGIELFDNLPWEQKFVLIDRVLACLLEPKIESPPRAAYLDATVAAIFVAMLNEIQMEIDMLDDEDCDDDDPTVARKRTLDAVLSVSGDSMHGDLPTADSTDIDDWRVLVDTLADRVLPDEDWALANSALDLPPSKANALKQSMGISTDYFSAIPPDANRDQARTAWASIIKRVTGKPIAEWRFGDGSMAHVMLEDVVDAMEMTPDDWGAYLIKETCQVCVVPDDLLGAGDEDSLFLDLADEWMIQDAKLIKEYESISLPDKFEIDEWNIMKKFSQSRSVEAHCGELLDSIHGRGAFRSFRRTLERLNLIDQWYEFRAAAIEAVAVGWLEQNGVQWLRKSDLE